MNQDLLAPPKFKPRGFAAVIGVVAALPAVGGIWFAIAGYWSLWELGWRLSVVIGVWAAVVFGYARMFRNAHRRRPERMVFLHMTVGMSTFVVMGISMRIMLGGTGIASGMGFGFMVPMLAGGFLICGGLVRRVGESLHCPRCEYEFGFEPTD